ncbi:MAG: hypothetical protein IJS71_09780 [Clostridia bacterium]|nr:hypothetical protein [Clostridia bacterium]
MKRSELYDVIARLDEDLQQQAYELEQRPVPRKQLFFSRILPIAASCAAIIITAAVVLSIFLPKMIGGKDPGETPDQNPPSGQTLSATKLSYKGLNDDIVTFNAENYGAKLISTDVKGVHANCSGVFYNQYTGELCCFEHAFLNASGISLPKMSCIDFAVDSADGNLAAAVIRETSGEKVTGLWILDRKSDKARRVPLPEGCRSYDSITVSSSKSLCNGILCLAVNDGKGTHSVYAYDTAFGKYVKLADSKDAEFVAAEFLAEDIILIKKDDSVYFINTVTNVLTEVAGETNYSCGGKVFSVKNGGWLAENGVVVAAYDAKTGRELSNEKVLVMTAFDDGTGKILLKDTTTGEETVLLDDYDGNCCTWSSDFSCFYAYSAGYGKLLCYFTESGKWKTGDVKGFAEKTETVDKQSYAVFENYYLAAGNAPGNASVYYTRKIVKKDIVPEYEDEKTDSAFWDEYRYLKHLNFEKETSFYFGEPAASGEGRFYEIEKDDMILFRDILLKCLESRGKVYRERRMEGDGGVVAGTLTCGELIVYFIEYSDCFCVSVEPGIPLTGGSDIGVYEFPKTVFENVRGSIVP